MCLAVVGRLVSMEGSLGIVDMSGVEMKVGLQLVLDVKVGDWVLIHAGFAIQIIDEEEAKETLALLGELYSAGENSL
ncbi:MAG: HypC/HybG/HupF family hydrogenase formation chaperone [Spirochaetota bacterium]